jgi:hypothetical protein
MMEVKRRGQGSLEFLMTYGWVMLIILVVMVVLWQWGILSFGETIEPGSFGFWGLRIASNNEFILRQDGELMIAVLNQVGANITLTEYNVTISGQKVDLVCPDAGLTITTPEGDTITDCVIPHGHTRILRIQDNKWAFGAGKRFDAYVWMNYEDSRLEDTQFQSSGRLWGNTEL